MKKTERKDLLETLNGSEILSSKYEGVVGVKGLEVIQAGEVIDTLDTDQKISDLFNELFENEFGSGYLEGMGQ